MGYYTDYVASCKENPNHFAEKIDFHGGSLVNGHSPESCKWYEHETDMIKYSKQYPELTFALKGEGEEAGDVWIKYFKNGKITTHRPFDELYTKMNKNIF